MLVLIILTNVTVLDGGASEIVGYITLSLIWSTKGRRDNLLPCLVFLKYQNSLAKSSIADLLQSKEIGQNSDRSLFNFRLSGQIPYNKTLT